MVEALRAYKPNKFFENYPPTMQVSIRYDYPTIEDARVAEGVPLIKDLTMAYGNKMTSGWISKQLQAVVNFVGAAAMTDQQVVELAYQLQIDYGFLNLLEFIMFCSRMRSGKYKEFYGTVDPMAIMKSMDTFCKERFEEQRAAYQKREKEREEREREEDERRVMAFRQWYKNLPPDEKAKYDEKRRKQIQELQQLSRKS